MRRLVLSLFMISFAPLAAAQYKCVVGGKPVYSDAPCAANAKPVGALEDRVSQRQLQDRAALSAKERSERRSIEARQDAEFRAGQYAVGAAMASEQSQQRQAAQAKADRCAGAQQDLQDNQRAQARYKDWRWQNSLSQREQEARGIRETIRQDCR